MQPTLQRFCEGAITLPLKKIEKDPSRRIKRAADKRILKAMQKAQKDILDNQCEEIETRLNKTQQECMTAGQGSDFTETG